MWFTGIIILVLLFFTILQVIHEKSIAAFPGEFVARLIGSGIWQVVLGIVVGIDIYKRISKKWLGWVIGILFIFALSFVGFWIGGRITDVKRRMRRLKSEFGEVSVIDTIDHYIQ